ncbi:MAG: MarR family transcriptional regulator [Verrucomicrobia bacterium]|nr:MarR family transcriptional regulator [Verrucomicrobiota bacterium]
MPVTAKERLPAVARRLHDLPFCLAALYHGFRCLVDRLHLDSGLHLESVKPGMGTIFLALCDEDDCNVKHLVRRLCIPNATLTGLLDRMEKSGVIERCPCPDDGRAFRVRLTPFGRSLEPGMRRRHQHAMEILQAGLNESDASELDRLLGRVLTNLRTDEERWRVELKQERAKARAKKFSRQRNRRRD